MKSSPSSVGYSGLLNLGPKAHHLVVCSDFALGERERAKISKEVEALPTKLHFVSTEESFEGLVRALERAGIDIGSDYVSLHCIYRTHDYAREVRRLFEHVPNGDRSTIELPPDAGRATARAGHLLDVIARADYDEQRRISEKFFALIEAAGRYRIDVLTAGGAMVVDDDKPWFQLAGKLSKGESRGLPGGEVAYTGSSVRGTFVVDGAILATPAVGSAAAKAAQIGALSARVRAEPLTFHIEQGRIADIKSAGSLASELRSLLNLDDYRGLTEVGVSFNQACSEFVHDWAAPSNEGRPGVHIAIGGDPDPDSTRPPDPELVHIDFMAATTVVAINRRVFLRSKHDS